MRFTPAMQRGNEDATAKTQGWLARFRQGSSYSLEVQQGPDMGKFFSLDGRSEQPRMLLGQGPLCDVRLTDRQVSRRHAVLEVERLGLRYSDLGSTNGSRINGVSVTEAILNGGEKILVGATVLAVHLQEEFVVPVPEALKFGRLLGWSPELRRLFPLFGKMAASDLPLVIEGETGTGKEILAESIHEASPRAQGPFVVFDCTTVSSNLVEAMLFGHERGAFTGAIASQRGMFEEAHGGTLFIDEIGDLDIVLQARLLRAIDRAQVRRVGGSKWTRVDTRIIAATRRNLDAEVQAGKFRDDLLFRLGAARVELPPLRKRQGDVAMLATAFWCQMGGAPEALEPAFLAQLEAHTWPGNVRELRNVIASRLALGESFRGTPEHDSSPLASAEVCLPGSEDFIDSVIQERLPFAVGRQRVVAEYERRFVEGVLSEHDGHVGRAAAAAGIGRRYFQVIRGRHRE